MVSEHIVGRLALSCWVAVDESLHALNHSNCARNFWKGKSTNNVAAEQAAGLDSVANRMSKCKTLLRGPAEPPRSSLWALSWQTKSPAT